ncbi:hypothetical protein E3N88_07410 [Mikania micrantha]|uniref:Reverse transcriptase zinc-binding domain-containing protein n=1 Tax=Mikania micrantha TaxID=192012 RepID=A0A5N6PRG9_9ASTR|nr:hypothetical protein E3N88_07410 [Mikania micrantha]
MVTAKGKGGLGLGGLKDLNLALITKWHWRFKAEPNQLWVKVIKAIHEGVRWFKGVPVKSTVTGVWKNIGNVNKHLVKAKVMIQEKLKCEVGKGYNVVFWTDSWLDDTPLCDSHQQIFRLAKNKKALVRDNYIKVGETLNWKWVWNEFGTDFSVKAVRSLIQDNTYQSQSSRLFFWNNWVLKKINVFVWRACMNKIPTKDALLCRGMEVGPSMCQNCGMLEESAAHLLVTCVVARAIWWQICRWLKIPYPTTFESV